MSSKKNIHPSGILGLDTLEVVIWIQPTTDVLMINDSNKPLRVVFY